MIKGGDAKVIMSNLVGAKITIFKHGSKHYGAHKYRYRIIAAYPHHVLCEKLTENGAVIRESFSKGTLIEQGIIGR